MLREISVGEEAAAHLPKHIKELIILARQNRRDSTTAEAFLWKILRNRKLHNRKFRRQHPFGRFIADFYCDDARLLVELDGSIHNNDSQRIRDEERDAISTQLGLTVLRFTNDDILMHTFAAITTISNYVLTHTFELSSPHPPAPSPEASGEGEL